MEKVIRTDPSRAVAVGVQVPACPPGLQPEPAWWAMVGFGRRPWTMSLRPPKTRNAMTVARIAQKPDVERAIALFRDALRRGLCGR